MTRPRRLATALTITALASLGATRVAEGHPIHSTITELAVDARGTVRATVRVFADDLRTGAERATGGRALPDAGPAWDAAILAYATRGFALADARGRPLSLRACGTRRTADVVWLCFEGDVGRDRGDLQVRNTILCDLHADQVNVVQAVVNGARRSLVFVRGDAFKTLR